MECCVCYNNIKKSFITCHSLCNKCHSKIKNNKCPICRNIMITTKINKYEEVEIEWWANGRRTMLMKNLKNFVFGKEFKKYLQIVLRKEGVNYKKDFVIIDYKKYDYNELLDFKTFCRFMQFQNNDCVFFNLIDRMINSHNIFNLTKKDIFYINNIVNCNEYETSEKRLITYIWKRENFKMINI